MKAILLIIALVITAHAQKQDLIHSSVTFTSNATITEEPNTLCASLREAEARHKASEDSLANLSRITMVGDDTAAFKKLDAEVAERMRRACASNLKRETGTLNGVAYTFYYSDGSGGFASIANSALERADYAINSWRVGCEKDAITDERTCHVDRGDLRVWADSRGRMEIYIGSSHYPGSPVWIRIDKAAPLAINSRTFNGSFGYRASPAIISKISRAKTITTRYQKWPYTDYEDESWDNYGFKEAVAYIRWAVSKIK